MIKFFSEKRSEIQTNDVVWCPARNPMFAHDPRKLIEDLRQHLARHDKPIAFLIGAGASCAVRCSAPTAADPRQTESLIPAMSGLTQRCQREILTLGEAFDRAWKALEAECQADGEDPNIENILSRVQLKRSAIGAGEQLAGLSASGLEELDKKIRTTIADSVQPAEEKIPHDLPHANFAKWVARTARHRPLEIFTVNYDLLLERSLEAEKVPIFDGFVGSFQPFFCPESLQREQFSPGSAWTRLWKIHGSINWKLKPGESRRTIIRSIADRSGEMIFPSFRKYDESRRQPYVNLLSRLGRYLTQDDAFMVAVGYAFQDQHINSVIFDSLDESRRAHLYALQFVELPQNHPLIERAQLRSKVTVIGPETAVISGIRGPWRLMDPVDDSIAELLDIPFDSDATPSSEPSVTGRMRLGDFNYFCKFLASLATD